MAPTLLLRVESSVPLVHFFEEVRRARSGDVLERRGFECEEALSQITRGGKGILQPPDRALTLKVHDLMSNHHLIRVDVAQLPWEGKRPLLAVQFPAAQSLPSRLLAHRSLDAIQEGRQLQGS